MQTPGLVACLAGLGALLAACGDPVVERQFADEAALLRAQGDATVISRIDVDYPLRVVGREDATGELRFTHDGEPHFISPIEGFTLSALRVEHDGKPGVLVLRCPAAASQPPR